MGTVDQDAEQVEPRWSLIPLAEYQRPQAPASTSARRHWLSLKRLLHRRKEEPQGPVKTEDELYRLASERLDAMAGPIDWSEAAMALQQALEQRVTTDCAWVLVGPPGAGYGDLLSCWAQQQGALCLQNPGYDHLNSDHNWFTAWPEPPDPERPWTLPRLERCWLRHPAGLGLVRAFFDRLLEGRLGFGVIGCDSWAWAYLRFVVPTARVRALTYQAFDGERLTHWFAELAGAADARARRFRHAQSGNLVLRVNDEETQDAPGTELRYLAAQSRGTAAVALRLWRARLRSEPEQPEATKEANLEGDEQSADTSTERDGADVIWVAPAVDFALPTGLGESEALVLHALLLHDGLLTGILETLLPFTRTQTHQLVQQLTATDVVMLDDDAHWRVRIEAYPAVRAFLADRDFLTDAF